MKFFKPGGRLSGLGHSVDTISSTSSGSLSFSFPFSQLTGLETDFVGVRDSTPFCVPLEVRVNGLFRGVYRPFIPDTVLNVAFSNDRGWSTIDFSVLEARVAPTMPFKVEVEASTSNDGRVVESEGIRNLKANKVEKEREEIAEERDGSLVDKAERYLQFSGSW